MRNPLAMLRSARTRRPALADASPTGSQLRTTVAATRAAADARQALRADEQADESTEGIDLHAAMAQRLGLPATATEDEVVAEVAERLAARQRAAAASIRELPDGTSAIPTAELEDLRAAVIEGRRAVLASRDWAILSAITEGRLSPFQARSVAEMWALDPVGAREVLASRQPNTVPVAELGHATASETLTQVTDEDELIDQIIHQQQGETP